MRIPGSAIVAKFITSFVIPDFSIRPFPESLDRLFDRNVRAFSLMLAVGGLLMLAGDEIFGTPRNELMEAVVVGLVFVCLFASMSRRLVRTVSVALPLLLVAGISYAFVHGSGIHDPSSPAFVLVILIAAFFMGSRGALTFTAVSVFAATFVVASEVLNLYRTQFRSTAGTIITFDVIVSISGLLLWLIMRSLEKALDAARTASRELQQLNAELENRVQERTEELDRAQDGLIRSEKMAALGRLMAGIAHEINSPLGAIQSSVGTAPKILKTLVPLLVHLGELPGTDQERRLLELFSAVMAADRQSVMVTTAEERAALQSARTRLEEAGAEAATIGEMARMIAHSGIPQLSDLMIPFIGRAEGIQVLRAADSVSHLMVMLEAIRSSAGRLTKIVFALGAYAGVGADEEFRDVELTESIDQALALFGGQFRNGVELVRRYEYRGSVGCRPGSLGQVWINLIRNALQSLEGAGRLEIEISTMGEEVITRITDSGPGIPPAIQLRIFEPFFTTRRIGEGSGLGLDIARRIVEGHNGTITCASVPGQTTFEVRMPRTDPEKRENRSNGT